ncbi:MAG: glycosyltransferase family 39 protein [Deltaproteobacteria bacterium]|nr:glycosyltransferase family 39 protein [Deltaproteobacteria bacterium]
MSKKLQIIVLAGIVLLAFGLRIYRLSDDLPYNDLGPTGAFLLDEGGYQLSAFHKVRLGEWQLPGTYYLGWTIRGYQQWVAAFFNLFDPNLFSARLASVTAVMISFFLLLAFLWKRTSATFILLFGLLAAINYPFVMWSKFASPYPVVLLPAALFCLSLSYALERQSIFWSLLAGLFVAVIGTVKETSLFFFPIGILACLATHRWHYKLNWPRVLWNPLLISFTAGFIIPYEIYNAVYLAPAKGVWWNISAYDAQSAIQGYFHPSLKWAIELPKSYARYAIKGGGLLLIWATAFCGWGYFVRLLRRSSFPSKQILPFSIVMGSWFILMPFLLGTVNCVGGVGVQSVILFLLPVIYFATLSLSLLLAQQQKKAPRTLALLLLLLMISADLFKHQRWLFAEEIGRLHETSSRIAEAVKSEKSPNGPVILTVDSAFLLLRQPEIKSTYIRSFHTDTLPTIVAQWNPDFLLLEKWGNPRLESQVFEKICQTQFHCSLMMELPLGNFDKKPLSVSLYRLSQSLNKS